MVGLSFTTAGSELWSGRVLCIWSNAMHVWCTSYCGLLALPAASIDVYASPCHGAACMACVHETCLREVLMA